MKTSSRSFKLNVLSHKNNALVPLQISNSSIKEAVPESSSKFKQGSDKNGEESE